MDVLDAGVYVSKWEAQVPKGIRPVLWGPLQAKEMGFDGWEWQDGGETGFIAHNPHIRLAAGFATSTLIVVSRLQRAFVTVYFGGYPADAGIEQRRLDTKKVVGACELFLTRLAKTNVVFELQGEISLVDNVSDAAIEAPVGFHALPPEPMAAARRTAPPAPPAPSTASRGSRPVADRGSGVWEV